MKIFAIRDESTQEQKDLAYLLYYKQEKQFYIELPENADAWETPLLLDSFVKRRETTVNSYSHRPNISSVISAYKQPSKSAQSIEITGFIEKSKPSQIIFLYTLLPLTA